jgi:serine/threonine-protein kinase
MPRVGTPPPGRGYAPTSETFYDYDEPVRRRPIWPWLLALGLILSAAVAGWYVWTQIQDQLNQSKPVNVPLVRGLSQDAAKNQLELVGLRASPQFQSSPTVQRGVVIRQNPAAGEKTAKGNAVTIFVSNGKPKTTVPDVVGAPIADAIAALTQAHLKYEVHEINSPKEANTVIALAPGPGAVVPWNTPVRVNVSKGPKPVAVPSIVGQPYENATSALQGAGFAVKKQEVESDQPKGMVVASDPAPGTAVAPGSIVTLSVSKGPKSAAVPDVTSYSEADATTTLQSAGFKVQVTKNPTTDPALDGVVISQLPAGGTQAKPGTTVTIVVGSLQQTPTTSEPPLTTTTP